MTNVIRFIAIVIVPLLFTACGSAPKKLTKEEQLLETASSKYSIVKKAVAEQLSNPSSLDMDITNMSYTVVDASQNLVTCVGTAHSKNDFGMVKDFSYNILLRVEGTEVIVDLATIEQ